MLDQIEHLMGGLRHVGDSIAHDLRGPLTRLRTRLEALAAEPAPTRQSVEECLTQADGVLATFNALLRIARVESGAYRRAFANVDLGPIAADVAERPMPEAEPSPVSTTTFRSSSGVSRPFARSMSSASRTPCARRAPMPWPCRATSPETG